ncbi:hypothetical protein [Frankia sp. KB5]|uniref:helix-turn-helix transcriptional regulator n=1 Tax=Frankia sp. KB5 TaxID=683318 RepID=UPI000A11B601|nr:hypothetical protein [Frankia sp. KB5]ORT46977.1 hypothetical protein KBI5_22215 [Frankia sp. KB5]
MGDDDELLGYTQIAAYATSRNQPMKAQTVRNYRQRGLLPAPDDLSVPDRPRWRRDTITTWLDNRPGQGKRTDLRAKPSGSSSA